MKSSFLLILIPILFPNGTDARIGESCEAISGRLGTPYAALKQHHLFSWDMSGNRTLFLNVICDHEGSSVAEQLKGGKAEMTLEVVLEFFNDSSEKTIENASFSNGKAVEFSGLKINFRGKTRFLLDLKQGLLFVWKAGKSPTATIYTEEGIRLRVGLEPLEEIWI